MNNEIDTLIHQIEEGAEAQRRNAAMRMGRIRTRDCVAPLLKALQSDPSRLVRVSAIQSLSWIQDDSMIEPMINVVKNDSSDLVRKHAMEVLARVDINTHPKVKSLFEELQNSHYNGEIREIIESTLNKHRMSNE